MPILPEPIECGNCGLENAPGARFCKFCGADFSMAVDDSDSFSRANLLRWVAMGLFALAFLYFLYLLLKSK